MASNITLTSIGVVHSTRKAAQDDLWSQESSLIELDANLFNEECLHGLQDFSHIEVLFYMDRVDPKKINLKARHPRNNPDWPLVGIFAQRAKNRVNQIGTTVCKVTRVEKLSIFVEGLDAIDQTPVLDIKPWLDEFGPRGKVTQPQWSREIMSTYWK